MAITECAPPPTYMGIRAFLSLMGHYWQFIKGFEWIAQQLNKHLTVGESAERQNRLEDTLEAFQALKEACMSAPILTFADYTKDFYSKQMLLRKDWEWYFPKNKQMGNTTQLPMVGKPSLLMKRTAILQNSKFLAVKWAISDHFKEYLLYWPFLVRTDNNSLTYIMTTPNLDTTGH